MSTVEIYPFSKFHAHQTTLPNLGGIQMELHSSIVVRIKKLVQVSQKVKQVLSLSIRYKCFCAFKYNKSSLFRNHLGKFQLCICSSTSDSYLLKKPWWIYMSNDWESWCSVQLKRVLGKPLHTEINSAKQMELYHTDKEKKWKGCGNIALRYSHRPAKRMHWSL